MRIPLAVLLFGGTGAALQVPLPSGTTAPWAAPSTLPALQESALAYLREATTGGPIKISYTDFYDPSRDLWTRAPSDVELTPSGWFGLAFIAANTLWAPWGLVEVVKRGGLGPPEGQDGGLVTPGGMLRNWMRQTLGPKDENNSDDEVK
jgi:hypothetical protein